MRLRKCARVQAWNSISRISTKVFIMTTGIYYHPEFEETGYPVLKRRLRPAFTFLRDFIHDKCDNRQIVYKTPNPVDPELLQIVHTERNIAITRASGYYKSALLSAGGAVEAAVAVWEEDLNNAFVFTGTAGHHASRDHAWGFCYFNNTALAIRKLWRDLGLERVTVVDTDPHPGDGTQDCLGDNKYFQHFNFQSYGEVSRTGEIWNIGLPSHCDDRSFLHAVRAIKPEIVRFSPEILIWNFGHDAHMDDYGGFQLTLHSFPIICEELIQIAEQVCDDRLLVFLSGGSEVHVAKYSIASVVTKLTGCTELPSLEEEPTPLNETLFQEVRGILKKLKLL